MKKIPLNWCNKNRLRKLGLVALVDDADYAWLSKYTWCVRVKRTMVYAGTRIGKRIVYMHVMLMGYRRGFQVDHKNANGLNNCRKNLRWSTPMQNAANARKCQGNYTSMYKGVAYFKRTGKWSAQITVAQEKYHLGYCLDEVDAAHAYDAAARCFFGEFARLNFPDAQDA